MVDRVTVRTSRSRRAGSFRFRHPPGSCAPSCQHACALLASLAVVGCEGNGGSEAALDFGIHHGEPRPACEVSAEVDRTPFAMPAVVSGDWTEPRKLAGDVNTPCPEDSIEISFDGQALYFLGSPRVDASYDELLHGTTGVYVARRQSTDPGAFADPTFFDLRQGTRDGAADAELSFTPDGSQVFFHSTRAENTGYVQSPPMDDPLDIYVANITQGVPSAASNVGPPVNSGYIDGEHCLSPDGTKLFFASTRPGGAGGSDIWVAERHGDSFTEPVHLGAPINSTGADLQPAFAASDPSTMYFVSDRDGATSIYRSRFEAGTWSNPEMVLTGYVGEPSLTADGSLLYFVHVSVDAGGVFDSDVWYVQRQ